MLECWNAEMVSAQDTTQDVWETEALKAAAIAMRHSSKTQASAAYDKGATSSVSVSTCLNSDPRAMRDQA